MTRQNDDGCHPGPNAERHVGRARGRQTRSDSGSTRHAVNRQRGDTSSNSGEAQPLGKGLHIPSHTTMTLVVLPARTTTGERPLQGIMLGCPTRNLRLLPIAL
jgi:hypothetical protein